MSEETPAPRDVHGQCLCGAVTFTLTPPLRDVIICHCTQCAQWTGHLVAATQVPAEQLAISDPQRALSWYASSDMAERGFCTNCGSSLFWRRGPDKPVSVMAGTLDDPSGLRVGSHIFAQDQRAYVATDHGTAVSAASSMTDGSET